MYLIRSVCFGLFVFCFVCVCFLRFYFVLLFFHVALFWLFFAAWTCCLTRLSLCLALFFVDGFAADGGGWQRGGPRARSADEGPLHRGWGKSPHRLQGAVCTTVVLDVASEVSTYRNSEISNFRCIVSCRISSVFGPPSPGPGIPVFLGLKMQCALVLGIVSIVVVYRVSKYPSIEFSIYRTYCSERSLFSIPVFLGLKVRWALIEISKYRYVVPSLFFSRSPV